MSDDQQTEALGNHETCGVEGSEESAKWFWNRHFSAVAGDAIAFETLPPLDKNGKVVGVEGLGEFLSAFPCQCRQYGIFVADGKGISAALVLLESIWPSNWGTLGSEGTFRTLC